MSSFRELPGRARVFLAGVTTAGAVAAILGVALSPPPSDVRAALLLTLAIAAGFVRVPLPVGGSLSPAYAFVLANLMSFGVGASILASVASAVITSVIPPRGQRRPPGHRTVFNAGAVAIASASSGLAYLAIGGSIGNVNPVRDAFPILTAAAVFSALNLGSISMAVHLSGAERVARALRENYVWSVPSFLASSSLAALLALLVERDHLGLLLLAAPFVYLMHLAYRARSRQAEEERRHSHQTAEHYRAVTEALALAIEAKDENTEDHLRRVQQFSAAIGRALRLPQDEMEALKAASLLHDIGKIAVPEYILTKPGRLSAEESERMKVHPRVGAEILSAVPFPYPLAPIVRHHHERWDGGGYPEGLAGRAIPVGARVLAVADCYDALTSDRPYRRALPPEEAVEFVRRESGGMFDPDVVEAFLALPALVGQRPDPSTRLFDRLVEPRERAAAPAAAAASASALAGERSGPRLHEEISSSQDERQALLAIARTVGRHLDLDESLTLLSAKIARLIPYRSLVVFLHDAPRQQLVARFATGQAAARLGSLVIPLGEGLAGWSAVHRRAYIGKTHERPLERDGSRSDLEALAGDPEVADLRSTLVAPLSAGLEDVGVLALYHGADHPYIADHLRLAQAVGGYFAQTIKNARRLAETHPDSLTDPVTGIPNSRFFFTEAGYRIDRASSVGAAFGVLAFRLESLDRVNDTLGATASARLLSKAARQLLLSTHPGETLVRFGGDLFLFLANDGLPAQLARRSSEVTLATRSQPVDARFGITEAVRFEATYASFPFDGSTTEEILDVIESRLRASSRGHEGISIASRAAGAADPLFPDVL